MKMLMENWLKPADTTLEIYPATCDIKNKKGQSLISVYAVHRTDHSWSFMLINKDPLHTLTVDINVMNTITGKNSSLKFPLQSIQYSSQQYHWVSKKSEGYPSSSLPPLEKIINSGNSVSLPPYSLTVLSETRSNK
jgi:hypothetical protein